MFHRLKLQVFQEHYINSYMLHIMIIVIIISISISISIIELTHSKTILENTVKIEPQPVALDFKNLSQYSSHSKKNCLLNLCCSCCNTNLLQSITKLFGYSTVRAYNYWHDPHFNIPNIL